MFDQEDDDTFSEFEEDELHPLLRVDLRQVGRRDELLATLAHTLDLPPLHDWQDMYAALTNPDWMAPEGCVLALEHSDHFARENPADFLSVLESLQQVAEYWRERGLSFWTLVGRDDGDTDLPQLH
jgi:Barstar (barnase inhibitor)